MKRIEIYDIDGCICKNIFPNLGEKADIKLLKEEIVKTPLDSGFIKYYKLVSNRSTVKPFFLTGRKAVDFQIETLEQLKPLKINHNQLIFYPDNYSYSKIRYYTFKIYNILAISVKNKNTEVIVYDDMDGYVSKLMGLGLKLKIDKIKVEVVSNPKDYWKLKLKRSKLINKKKEDEKKEKMIKLLNKLFPADMRKYNRPGNRPNELTERISVLLTPQQMRGVNIIIRSGKFNTYSEFIRYLIVKYFDDLQKEG